MSVQTTVLFPTAALTASIENGTAAKPVRFLVDKLITYASTGGLITVKSIPAGGTAGAANVVAKKTFTDGESYVWPEVAGTTLMEGETLSFLPASGVVANLKISGRTAS